MAKTYELGVARVTFDNPLNKVPAMVNNMDKMSAQGWELKATFDAVSEVIIFYQREVTPTIPPISNVVSVVSQPTTASTI